MSDQRGMALVEMLIVVALTGLIVGLPGTAIYQFTTVNERGSRTLTALHDLQNAASWLSRDGQMATTANVSGSDRLEIILSDNSSITYGLAGSGPLYELRRTVEGSSEVVIARHVTGAYFNVDDRVITMTITSSPVNRWGVAETKMYRIFLRQTEESE